MDYFMVVCTVVVYVENRVKGEISYAELEKETGFSIAHIRELFVQTTGQPLARYVLERKICNAAFDVAHSRERLGEIAARYGFQNPDTFTRAFRRVAGVTPSEFRKKKLRVGRIKLCAGVYGVGFPSKEERI